jgi:hypothetical protein
MVTVSGDADDGGEVASELGVCDGIKLVLVPGMVPRSRDRGTIFRRSGTVSSALL